MKGTCAVGLEIHTCGNLVTDDSIEHSAAKACAHVYSDFTAVRRCIMKLSENSPSVECRRETAEDVRHGDVHLAVAVVRGRVEDCRVVLWSDETLVPSP